MLGKLFTQNFEKISDLEKLIPKDEIYKFGRTYHFNAIALNKTGLKNYLRLFPLLILLIYIRPQEFLK